MIKGNRTDVGVWSPSCVQHGFGDQPAFNNDAYRIPTGTGLKMSDAIAEFLADPTNAKSHMDDIPWPLNKGCCGMKQKYQLKSS